MAGVVPRVKHLVVEMRYNPTLAIYGAMDRVGMALASSFPDWERSPLTLEIRDKKNWRRSLFSHQRSFYEAVGRSTDVASEFDRATKVFDKLKAELDFPKIRRLGIRQWAAIEVKEKFETLVKTTGAKLQPQQDTLLNALKGAVDDISYVVSVKTSHGWRYTLKMGPMQRKQWFELIRYEEGMFPSPEEFKEYKESIPETMLFFDLDASQEDVPYSELTTVLASVRRDSQEILADLSNYTLG